MARLTGILAVFSLIVATGQVLALTCYAGRLLIGQLDMDTKEEQLPADISLESNCTSCQRIRMSGESGISVTWVCHIPRPIMVPACPDDPEPMKSIPPPPRALICAEVASRVRNENITSTTCSCCQDKCNAEPGCELSMDYLADSEGDAELSEAIDKRCDDLLSTAMTVADVCQARWNSRYYPSNELTNENELQEEAEEEW